MPEKVAHLARSERTREGHVEVRLPEVALVLRNLVFEHEVVAPGLPGDLGSDAMVLVPVLEPVGEDQVGPHRALQVLDERLDLAEFSREAAIGERAEHHALSRRAGEQRRGAAPRFLRALAGRAQHDPGHLGAAVAPQPVQHRAAAADFQVVAMRPEAQDAKRPAGGVAKGERQHAHLAGWRCQTIQGQLPRASMRSKVILSLNVSIDCQKPWWRYTASLRRSMRRWKGFSTSSSPSSM